ncbi:unnamed protein product [Cyberlindnera jadinii]|uniref:Snf7-domain-containing protein n=1 Tax=Cyberlindnera jadinii (strain ATCC 18201 / CBS 1600 / BCRC 20928 / JCM 3617 / NBRC 0987 / NRRL Y-1542) TaxID=983966 RepID=A0A0H5C367_CYBJN|nr:hypothetical protein CYBJADRAFT_165877 [Cyberlindnera jadinii NRRL Y-1542]ODV75116.1 hypothetical protein CYBJADRAFT_165877 [Cyberlindnera jadinii NRRL Y-1542]CEP22303.1 unnamed protein product [Cyberlindnera jadinii]
MGNTSSAPRVTAQDKAVLQVKLQKDKLVRYQKKMNLLVDQETTQIKVYLRQGKKNDAKVLLKKTKYQQKLLEDSSNQLYNLENMIHNIEFKLIEKDFLKGLQNGNAILSKLNNEMKVEDVERLVDEVQDNIAYQDEINEMLSNSVVGQDIEDEIDQELAALELEATPLDQRLPKIDGLAKVPEVAVDVLPQQKKESSKETRTALLA